jgi:hypothetical protein
MKRIMCLVGIALFVFIIDRVEGKGLNLENCSFVAQGDVFEEGRGLYYFVEHKGCPKPNYSIASVFDSTRHIEEYEEYNTKSDWKGWLLGVRVTKWLSWYSKHFEPYVSAEFNRASIKTSYIKNVSYNLDMYVGAKTFLREIPIKKWGKNIILSLRMELGAGYVGGDGLSFAPVNLGFEMGMKGGD